MSFPSVSGKNWIFKKFDPSDVIKLSENFVTSDESNSLNSQFFPLTEEKLIFLIDF